MLMFSRNTLDTCSVAALEYCTIFYPRLALHSLHADRASGIKKYIYIYIYSMRNQSIAWGFYFSYYLFYRTRFSIRCEDVDLLLVAGALSSRRVCASQKYLKTVRAAVVATSLPTLRKVLSPKPNRTRPTAGSQQAAVAL